MELVVGGSEATMKSVMGKLGGLLAKEYTLIRGVNGDLQYINDELASMQSFLRDLATIAAGGGQHSHGHRMKDWVKQIRDITYDIEDCIGDSSHRLKGLRADMSCYFLANSVYEILTWWPRRDIAAKISVLKMRAQQIGERRERYGVNNPEVGGTGTSSETTEFNAADNQDASLQLVAMKDPVGFEDHMKELEEWVNNENSCGVLYIVGYGGAGKTTMATALLAKFGEQFDYRAMVTVSNSSDVKSVLTSILCQVLPQSGRQEQEGVEGVLGLLKRGTSALAAKCCSAGTSEETRGGMSLSSLKMVLKQQIQENRYLEYIESLLLSLTNAQ